MPTNWQARENKLDRRRNAMKVNGRSIVTVLMPVIAKKGREASASLEAKKSKEGRSK